MRICLIAPPTIEHIAGTEPLRNESDRHAADRIPLGVLAVAAAIERSGYVPEVLDLNPVYRNQCVRAGRDVDFVAVALESLKCRRFDVIGLGTLCSTYPTTLRIAAEIKRETPGVGIVLGGPQASVVDVSTLRHFESVDAIVRGEADVSFPALIRALDDGSPVESVAGITFRQADRIVRNQDAPPVLDLDALPLPAFHLLPGDRNSRVMPLELGRGCPFACTFCSTNDFFRRRFRLKSPAIVLQDMQFLNRTYGADTFVLVHDMFTVDRKRVADFCNTMIEAREGFRWTCSARTDCVDEPLLELMERAGCAGIFFGIETGSRRMQHEIDKCLDLQEAARIISTAARLRLGITVSMIVGYPQEEKDDLRATFGWLTESTRHDEVDPQVSLLAPLAATPILTQYRDELTFDRQFSDFAYTALFERDDRLEIIRQYPEVFPNFYALPTRVPREYLMEAKLFFLAAHERCRWLLLAAHTEMGGFLQVFDSWTDVRPRPDNLIEYYASPGFPRDLSAHLAAAASGRPAPCPATKVLAHAQALLSAEPLAAAATSRVPSEHPQMSAGLEVHTLPGSVEAAIDALRNAIATDGLDQTPAWYLLRRVGFRSELAPIDPVLARVLRLCNGCNTPEAILETAMGKRLSPEAAKEALEVLAAEGMLAAMNA